MMSCLSAMASTVEVITMLSLYLAIKAITGTTRAAISYFHLQPLQNCQWLFIASSDSSAHFGVSFVQPE